MQLSSVLGIPYGEAWLLQTAVKYFVPLTLLAMSDEAIYWQFYHSSHHMTRDELLQTLWALFERGDLIADHELLGEHVPTREQISAALVPPVRQPNGGVAWGTGPDAPLSYGLSPAGAARWERLAKPDWARYFAMEGFEEHEQECREVVAGSRNHLDELLQHSRGLWGREIDAGSLELDVVTPWEATYWKTLPAGYRARFSDRYEQVTDFALDPTPEYRQRVWDLRRWCRNAWDASG